MQQPALRAAAVLLLLPLAAAPAAAASVAAPTPRTSLVDPLVGTRGGGGWGGWGCPQLNPGAMAPFPNLRLGPDTTRLEAGPGSLETWSELNRKAGYFGSDNAVRAFSHTHVQGAGMADMGNVGVMVTRTVNLSTPVALTPISLFNELFLQRSPWASGFNASTEAAAPGIYSLSLTDAATDVELVAAGVMSGIHRYTCRPAAVGNTTAPAPCTLVVDVCHNTHNGGCGGSATTAAVAYNGTLGGWVVTATVNSVGDFTSRGNGTGVAIHWVGLLAADNATAVAHGIWAGHALVAPAGDGAAVAVNDSLGVYVTFPPPALPGGPPVTLTLRAALSWTSPADAWANLLAEQWEGGSSGGGWVALEAAAAATDAAWEMLLSSVDATPVTTPSVSATETGPDDAAQERWGVLSRLHLELVGAPSAAAEGDAAARKAASLRAFLLSPAGAAWAVTAGFVPAAAALGAADGAVAELRQRGGAEPTADAVAVAQAAAIARLALSQLDAVAAALEGPPLPQRTSARRRSRGGGDAAPPTDLVVLYSSLYHAFCAPTTYSNTAGRTYLGFDGAVHALPPGQAAFYSDLSLWDIYRSQAPLLSVLLPRASGDLAESLLAMAAQSGAVGLPRWPFANVHSDVMVAEHGIEVLFDCWAKGACGPPAGRAARSNVTAIYAAVAAAIERQETVTSPLYRALGYAPYAPGGDRASVGLEYATNDGTAAALAAAAGDAAGAATLANRSGWYRAVWCGGGLDTMCPRFANGSFLPLTPGDRFVPHPFDEWYTEGDAIQWQWAVPHDVPGLLALFPAPATESFAAALHAFLANQSLWFHNGTGPGTALPNPWAWLGNEPSLLQPWMFPWAGGNHTWRTQFWTRWVMGAFFVPGPATPAGDAVPGNDDYATMSAWAAWAQLGLYPVGGTTTYVLGAPAFSAATMAVPPGWDTPANGGGNATAGPRPVLRIVAHNASASNVFACAAAVDGAPLPSAIVDHTVLFPPAGAGPATPPRTLEFWMSPVPLPWAPAGGPCGAGAS